MQKMTIDDEPWVFMLMTKLGCLQNYITCANKISAENNVGGVKVKILEALGQRQA